MNQTTSNQKRILAIALSTRGFGFVVMEGENRILECGVKEANGDRNAHSLAKLERLVNFYQPEMLVLQDMEAKDSRRRLRIKRLNRRIIKVAAKRELKIKKFSDRQLKRVFFEDGQGTKHAMAEAVAQRFPDELGSRLPPKRHFYDREDHRMDIFSAVALAMAFWTRNTR